MKASQVLQGTIELFSDPSKWTKGTFARDAGYKVIGIEDPEANCFCIMGGIAKTEHTMRCMDDHIDPFGTLGLPYVNEVLGETTIPAFNDAPTTKISDVLILLYKAKVLAEKSND